MGQEMQRPFAEKCYTYAEKIDAVSDKGNIKSIKQVLQAARKIADDHDEPAYAYLFYCIGTGYMSIMQLKSKEPQSDHSELASVQEEALWYLYRADKLLEDVSLQKVEYRSEVMTIRCQIYVNLGNLMNVFGRIITANRYYSKAIAIYPFFGMALGNIGKNLMEYAFLFPQCSDRDSLYRCAYINLDMALSQPCNDIYDEARCAFDKRRAELVDFFGLDWLNKPVKTKKRLLGRKNEQIYRLWCLENHLFLNPLNDIPDYLSASAEDTIQIASVTTPAEQKEPPVVFEMLNQMKEEFIYARYLVYENEIQDQKVMFADKHTHIQDTLTYACYSIRIEKLKTAFRTLYSLFDRTAFLLNTYYHLGIKDEEISFNHDSFTKALKNLGKTNPALCALHWINNELRTKSERGKRVSPIATVPDIRNALEHKFVSVQLFSIPKEIDMGSDAIYRISEDELQACTHELLQVVREVIIELTLAIEIEERRKRESEPQVFRVPMTELPDEFKL